MEKINNLIILITPFHKMVVDKLYSELLSSDDTLILYSEFVDSSEISAKKRELINYNFSRSELFSSPFKNFIKTKKKIKLAKNSVNSLVSEFDFSLNLSIIICSDKDIFTQILLNKLFENQNQRKLTAIEEGLGFYVNTNIKDKLFSWIYKVATPVLFASRLYYVKRLGIYPKISTIYLRAINLLPESASKKIDYKTFKFDSQINNKEIIYGNCLFFSFPEQDYQMSLELKMNLIEDIAKYANKSNKQLIIKPHPRENIELIRHRLEKNRNIKILDKRISGENLNYFDYEFIINFFSSIILDIIEKEYPQERLLTIGVKAKPPIKFDKKLKYCSLKNFVASNDINFDA